VAWTISPVGARAARELALLAMIGWLTAGPAAQGLAEVARRSTGRAQATPGRTYTNADVEPARPIEPDTSPEPSEPVAAPASGPVDQPDKAAEAPVTATPGPLTKEARAQQEARAAHARKLADELGTRLRQRQERVQALRKELQDLQPPAAGKPSATAADRDALQQSLSDAERELARTQRAVARAEARGKDAAPATTPPPQQ
jgi:hypothetical protein